ncbi:MAG: AraC family transcriptional regulator [bacterium]
MKYAAFISKQVVFGKYYFLNLNPEKGTFGTVVCGGLEKCEPHYRIARNRFKYHCIEFVAAGKGDLTVSGKRYPLRPGTVFYYSPKTRHEITTDPGKPLIKYFVDFCGTRFTRLLRQHPLACHAPCYLNPTPRIQDVFENLQQSGRGAGVHAQAICACLLELLLLQIRVHALSQGDAESTTHHTYRQCRDLIENRFIELHTLREIAQECGIDGPYLCRLFQRHCSESPYQMLLRLKMRHATDLLSGSPALIKQIAKTVGFTDPYHFSRVFKTFYGVSPKAFLQSTHRAPSSSGTNGLACFPPTARLSTFTSVG